MAVKTAFSLEELGALLGGHGLGALRALRPIEAGTVQTNYRLEADGGCYVFRCYENRALDSVRFEAELLDFLAAQGFPCPAPVHDRAGSAVGQVSGKPFVLFPFLPGRHVEHQSAAQRRQVIAAAARMSALTRGYRSKWAQARLNYTPEICAREAKGIAERLGTPQARKKLQWYTEQLAALELPAALPMGACHTDFHFTNVLFVGERLSALIDFDDANLTYSCFDLVSLTEPFRPEFRWDSWQAFDPGAPVLDFAGAREAVAVYQETRPLEALERRHLFDLYKLGVLIDCLWYFDRGAPEDFYERRKLEAMDSLGREEFGRALFEA